MRTEIINFPNCGPPCGGGGGSPGDGCCGKLAKLPCARLSSPDGCHDCMDGKIIPFSFSGNTWSGSANLACGDISISVICDVPELGGGGAGCPGPQYWAFEVDSATVGDAPNVTQGDCDSDGMTGIHTLTGGGIFVGDPGSGAGKKEDCGWGEKTGGNFGVNVGWMLYYQPPPFGDVWLLVYKSLLHLRIGAVGTILNSSFNPKGPNTFSMNYTNFDGTVGCQGPSTITIFPSHPPDPKAPPITPSECSNYKLTLSCGGESLSVYPTTCSCDPFFVEFPSITLTSCCNGTVTVTFTTDCPKDCSQPGLICCCDTVPVSWKVTTNGWSGTCMAISGSCDGSVLNGSFIMSSAPPGPCTWSHPADLGAGQPIFTLQAMGSPPLWNLFIGITDCFGINATPIPAANFDCLGPNVFSIPNSPCPNFPSTILIEPA